MSALLKYSEEQGETSSDTGGKYGAFCRHQCKLRKGCNTVAIKARASASRGYLRGQLNNQDFLAEQDHGDPGEDDEAILELVFRAHERADRVDGILQHECVDLRQTRSDERQKQRRKDDEFVGFDVWDEVFKNLIK